MGAVNVILLFYLGAPRQVGANFSVRAANNHTEKGNHQHQQAPNRENILLTTHTNIVFFFFVNVLNYLLACLRFFRKFSSCLKQVLLREKTTFSTVKEKRKINITLLRQKISFGVFKGKAQTKNKWNSAAEIQYIFWNNHSNKCVVIIT